MRPLILTAALAAIVMTVSARAAEPTPSPYAGQQARSIKALSDEDIKALRDGAGMALAKAAELNGYPGPLHVIELAGELKLTPEQMQSVTAIRERMTAARETAWR